MQRKQRIQYNPHSYCDCVGGEGGGDNKGSINRRPADTDVGNYHRRGVADVGHIAVNRKRYPHGHTTYSIGRTIGLHHSCTVSCLVVPPTEEPPVPHCHSYCSPLNQLTQYNIILGPFHSNSTSLLHIVKQPPHKIFIRSIEGVFANRRDIYYCNEG